MIFHLDSNKQHFFSLTHIILHQFIRMKQTEAKKERSKEQWKKEAKKKTLTAIEHEEEESSSQQRRKQGAFRNEDTKRR